MSERCRMERVFLVFCAHCDSFLLSCFLSHRILCHARVMDKRLWPAYYLEKVDDLASLETCELIWKAGVGFANKPSSSAQHDQNRTEILKLLLTCFSKVIYAPITDESRLRWVAHFTSAENRNVECVAVIYLIAKYCLRSNPVGMGLPYNYLLFNDSREPLVEATRLLSNPLQSTYLPNSAKKVNFHQELLVLLWKCCEYNQKVLFYVSKTSVILEILVPILYHITESRNDPTRVGLIHMGVFLVLLLSGDATLVFASINHASPRQPLIYNPSLVFHKFITT
ncbi:unnamed protein product [Cylicocyclus nassatus]|uniref:Uncharacterized protein n=1 Tax=Cylicocyclus nassatus TaxID=53992 RepID=A0AA36DSX4_CYLNA|nr:unnamed protein product [Cylicocyclus nassatus]